MLSRLSRCCQCVIFQSSQEFLMQSCCSLFSRKCHCIYSHQGLLCGWRPLWWHGGSATNRQKPACIACRRRRVFPKTPRCHQSCCAMLVAKRCTCASCMCTSPPLAGLHGRPGRPRRVLGSYDASYETRAPDLRPGVTSERINFDLVVNYKSRCAACAL